MRAQASLLDASVAALVYIISAYFVLSGSAAIAGAASDSFNDFSREKRLYEASEVALRSAEKGFAEKAENRILHHGILESKIGRIGNITASKSGNEGLPRIALCDGETCVLRFK